jgi:hypothetical protein
MDMSSSPFNEQEIQSMLLANGTARRALPQPPPAVAGPDGSVVSTPLTPRPSVKSKSGSLRRKPSEASSYYSNAPTRRGTNRSNKEAPSLGMTISELRRKNSVVSSYSVASVASTVVDDGDSPTLPDIFNGKVIPPRQVPKPGAMGARHYLNIGKTSHPKHKSMMSLGKTGSKSSRHKRNQSDGLAANSSGGKRDKENQDDNEQQQEPQRPRGPRRIPTNGPKETSASAPVSRAPSSKHSMKLKQGAVADFLARDKSGKRDSLDSLGLYDHEGFLLPSPDREARRSRGLRM